MRESVPKIRLFINLLLTLQVCLGISLIAVTICYQHFLGTFLTDVESKMLTTKFFNTYIFGFQLIAAYACSASMWHYIWHRRYSHSIQILLKVWLFFCFLMAICGCATIWSLLTCADSITESAEVILYKGIDIYYMNPEWKLLWDNLQYTKQCCGVNGYQDWMQASWMTPNLPRRSIRNYRDDYFENLSDQEYKMYATTEWDKTSASRKCIKEKVFKDPLPNLEGSVESRNNDDGQEILAPYACCKHDSVSCYGNYIPRSEDSTVSIQYLNLTEISTTGCLSIFAGHMQRAVNILCTLMLSAILIDIIICCLTKYLMITNNWKGYCELKNDMSMYDDEGNALVVIKCPPNVKCIALEEQNTYDSDCIPNVSSDTEPCLCCLDERSLPNCKDGKNNNFISH